MSTPGLSLPHAHGMHHLNPARSRSAASKRNAHRFSAASASLRGRLFAHVSIAIDDPASTLNLLGQSRNLRRESKGRGHHTGLLAHARPTDSCFTAVEGHPLSHATTMSASPPSPLPSASPVSARSRVSGRDVFLHEHTQRVVRVIAKRSPPLIAG